MQTILPRLQLIVWADFWSVRSTFILKSKTLFLIVEAQKCGCTYQHNFEDIYFLKCSLLSSECHVEWRFLSVWKLFRGDSWNSSGTRCISSLLYKVTPFQQSQVFAMHYAVIIYSWLLSLHYPWFYMWSLVLIICKMYSFIAPHKEMEEVTLLKKHWLRFFFFFNEEKIITYLS